LKAPTSFLAPGGVVEGVSEKNELKGNISIVAYLCITTVVKP